VSLVRCLNALSVGGSSIRWALCRFVRRSGGGKCAADGGGKPLVKGFVGELDFCDLEASVGLRSSMRRIWVSAVNSSIDSKSKDLSSRSRIEDTLLHRLEAH
jgi:hypothetical protein